MALASGKYSWAICDRCGCQMPYRDRVKERNPNNGAGYLIVHRECRFTQPRVVRLRPDPTGLEDARPDVPFNGLGPIGS